MSFVRLLQLILCSLFLCGEWLLNAEDGQELSRRALDREKRKRRNANGHTPNEAVTTESYEKSIALDFHFSDAAAAPTLRQWAKELQRQGSGRSGSSLSTEYVATHSQAIYREREVVQRVNSGEWSPAAYHEYQRMAAVTGNVDSARLLRDYAVDYSLTETILSAPSDKEGSRMQRLFRSAVECDTEGFERWMPKAANSISNLHNDAKSSTNSGELSLLHEFGAISDGTNLLMAAAYAGCEEIIRQLLFLFPLDVVDTVGLHGLSALMTAVLANQSSAVHILLHEGNANLLQRHKFAGSTVLHMAAELHHTSTIAVLCSFLYNISEDTMTMKQKLQFAASTTSTGSTALHVAAQHSAASEEDGVSIMHVLVEGCHIPVDVLMNDDTTALYLAAQEGHAANVRALLRYGADPNFAMPKSHSPAPAAHVALNGRDGMDASIVPLNTEPGNGAQPLHAAAEYGHEDVVRELLAGGADINSVTIGATPLHLAVQYNRIAVVKELLNHATIDVNAQAVIDGGTPLYHAVGYGNLRVVDLLLRRRDVDVNKRQIAGGSPLFYATITDRSGEVVRLLLRTSSIDVLAQLPEVGLTALHGAVSHGNLRAVEALLSSTSPTMKQLLYAVSSSGDTVLHLAAAVVSKDRKEDKSSLSSRLLNLLLHRLYDAEVEHAASSATGLATPIGWWDSAVNIINSAIGVDGTITYAMPKQLLKKQRTADGFTALHVATARGDFYAAHAILSAMAANSTATFLRDVDATDADCRHTPNIDLRANGENGPTALFLAVTSHSLRTIRLLRSHGADVDAVVRVPTAKARSKNRMIDITPLLTAIESGKLGVVRALIEPLCSNHSREDCVTCASFAGADVDQGAAGTSNGAMQSPLLFAVVHAHADIARYLLTKGAHCGILIANSAAAVDDVTQQQTLVDVARSRRDFDTLQVLMSFPQCDPSVIRAQQE